MKKSRAFHPFLFALFPVLFLYSRAMNRVYFSDIFLPLGIIISVTALLFLVPGKLAKNYAKAGIIASLGILLFFSFGHVEYVLLDTGIFAAVAERADAVAYASIAVAVPYALIAATIVFFTVRTKRELAVTTKILNFAALSLVAISVLNILYLSIIHRARDTSPDSAYFKEENIQLNIDRDNRRDIYLIVLDGYGRSDTLRRLFGYDNGEFIGRLRGLGFRVNERAYTKVSSKNNLYTRRCF